MRTKQGTGSDIPSGRWREPQARRVLREWRDSGLSARAFAQKHGLNAQRLLWWRRRIKRREETAPVPVTFVPAEVTGAGPAVVLRLPGGIAVEMSDVVAVPPGWIAALAAEFKRQS